MKLPAAPYVAPPPQGARRVREEKSTLVVGGGLAGVAAAVVLAERGVRVTLVERERFLGGRAGAWTESFADGGGHYEMERGFHAFFRQYYNVRALLRRIDPELRMLVPLRDYPILGPSGAIESYTGIVHTPLLNLAHVALRTKTFHLRDLPRVDVRTATEMIAFDAERTYRDLDHMTAREYLDSLQFPPAARQMLFDVFAHSFFNDESEMSAAELVMMFHFYFVANPEGLVFDVARDAFSTSIWKPFERHLRSLGVTLLLGHEVRAIAPRQDGGFEATFTSDASSHAFDACVLAANVPGLRALVEASPSLGDATFRDQIASLDVAPPFAVWRLFYDRPLAAGRAPFAGTTGVGMLDNISLFHLFEEESQRWARRTGGSVVELHAYACPKDASEAFVREDLLRGLHAFYPETRDLRVRDENFLLRRDCAAFSPGSHARRPTVETDTQGLVLAGDFVRGPVPSALMERAVTTGFAAANTLLHRWGARGEPIASIPRHGVLAPAIARLRRMTTRAGRTPLRSA